MIDPATADAFDRIASRADDVRNAYRPGYTPKNFDVATTPRGVSNADPLGVATPDDAYLVVGENDGPAYTRDGGLHVENGELRSIDGKPVLGFGLADHTRLVPMRVDPYDAALGRARGTRVDADGSVSYERETVEPRSGSRRTERVTIGRLALARFPAATPLVRIDGDRVRPGSGAAASYGVPGDGAFGALTTHRRDLGRVDMMVGLEKLKEAYDQYEAIRSAHHGKSSAEKTTMDLVK